MQRKGTRVASQPTTLQGRVRSEARPDRDAATPTSATDREDDEAVQAQAQAQARATVHEFVRLIREQPFEAVMLLVEASGEHQIPAQARLALRGQQAPAGNPVNLPPRLRETLELLALDLNTHQIAERMCISPATVETNYKKLRRRLHVAHTYELVAVARTRGVLPPASPQPVEQARTLAPVVPKKYPKIPQKRD